MTYSWNEKTPSGILVDRIKTLMEKIDAKRDAAEEEGTPLAGAHLASVTRWNNEIVAAQEVLVEREATEAAKAAQVPATGGQVVTDFKPSAQSEAIKCMQRDIDSVPMLSGALDVAVFVRRAQTVYNTHVLENPLLEGDFCKKIETRLTSEYRHTYQTSCPTRKKTWADFKEYLVEKHRSKTTVFQELTHFMKLPMLQNESIRAYAARLKTVGSESSIIIRSKFKDQMKREINVDDCFELMFAGALVDSLKSHPVYRKYFHRMVTDIDNCFTVDDLAAKATTHFDRDDETPAVVATTEAMMAQTMQQNFDKLAALLAKGNVVPPTVQPKAERKKPSWLKKMSDKKFLEWAATQGCLRQKKNNGKCDREVCPFQHQADAKPDAALLLSSQDF